MQHKHQAASLEEQKRRTYLATGWTQSFMAGSESCLSLSIARETWFSLVARVQWRYEL